LQVGLLNEAGRAQSKVQLVALSSSSSELAAREMRRTRRRRR